MPRTRTAEPALNFAEPPPARRGSGRRSKWLPILEALRDHPDRSILLAEDQGNATLVNQINKGKLNGIEVGEFVATSRRQVNGDGKVTFDIYCKYVGS